MRRGTSPLAGCCRRSPAHRWLDLPGALRTRVAHSTLREWLRLYRAGGFDALKSRKRIDSGHPRALPHGLVEQLLTFKETEPDLSKRLIIEKARDKELIARDANLPIPTVHR